MNLFTLPYGKTELTFNLPDSFRVDTLTPQTIEPMADLEKTLSQAFTRPMGSLDFSHFDSHQTVGIAINDKTRPVPKPNPLLPLLTHLDQLGFAREKITIFISSGTHTPMPETDWFRILDKELQTGYPIVVHDCDRSPMVALGQTSYTTPVMVNEAFYNCALKITVGNIEPHHFMGFSGGVKTAAIGLASRETINRNHAMLNQEQTQSGIYESNPMRQDVEEIGQMAGVHFCLGTVLDEEKHIMQAFFGSPTSVIQAAIPLVRQVFGVQVSAPYDLVIASPGGAPKDINLYQTQKGLTHAARIAKDGAWVLLLAACPEGSGSASYERYIQQMSSHEAVLADFKSGFFQVGPHKAFQIAKDASRIKIVLVSDIPPEKIKTWKLTPSQPDKLQQVVDWLSKQLPASPRVAILPAATRTMAEVHHVKS